MGRARKRKTPRTYPRDKLNISEGGIQEVDGNTLHKLNSPKYQITENGTANSSVSESPTHQDFNIITEDFPALPGSLTKVQISKWKTRLDFATHSTEMLLNNGASLIERGEDSNEHRNYNNLQVDTCNDIDIYNKIKNSNDMIINCHEIGVKVSSVIASETTNGLNSDLSSTFNSESNNCNESEDVDLTEKQSEIMANNTRLLFNMVSKVLPINVYNVQIQELYNHYAVVRYNENNEDAATESSFYPKILKLPNGLLGLLHALQSNKNAPESVSMLTGQNNISLYDNGLRDNDSRVPYEWCRLYSGDFADELTSDYYLNGRVHLRTPKINQMGEELLFYLFYLHTGDIIQLLAATELSERGWRYLINDQVWIRRIEQQSSNGQNELFCDGYYNYFSVNFWKVMTHYFKLECSMLAATITKADLYQKFGRHPLMDETSYCNN